MPVSPTDVISSAGSVVSSGLRSLTRPIKFVGEAIMYSLIPEEVNDADQEEDEPRLDEGLSLEGTLWVRKGKSTGNTTWKRRLVILDFENDGCISVYRLPKYILNNPSNLLKKMYTKVQRSKSTGKSLGSAAKREAVVVLPPTIPWIVKNVDDSSCFVVEIPTTDPRVMMHFHDDDMDSESESGSHEEAPDHTTIRSPTFRSTSGTTCMSKDAEKEMESDYHHAKGKQKPMRFYFRCPRKGNEKTLWLKAFGKLERLSVDVRHKTRLIESLSALANKNSRMRPEYDDSHFFRDARQLESGQIMSAVSNRSFHLEVEEMARTVESSINREFRVFPSYCYPHVWMTRDELREECNLPSTEFHDLRIPSQDTKEIGLLQVEVLQCMGLPKLDRSALSDAVVYLVMGSYAFATDVIPNNLNPIWPRKARRACIFPVMDGFSRLYAGCFDDDPKDTTDDFAGRVCINLSSLRPGCSYDVLIPLRLSTHVYMRRSRGVIRLRFQLQWHDERKALLSYIPKKLQFRGFKPRTHTTVACTDARAFRNIALTVHGKHMQGKFTFVHFRAALREINFSRKCLMLIIRKTVKDTIQWRIPSISLFVCCAWIHSVIKRDFSLVLPYFTIFVLLHMLRAYAIYGIDGPAQRGFIPPTFEELLYVLLFGSPGQQHIEPMELTTRHLESRDLSLHVNDTIKNDSLNVRTHKVWGKWFLRALGFLESEKELAEMPPNERYLEFPYASGTDYPKFTVKEAVVVQDLRRKAAPKTPPPKLTFARITNPISMDDEGDVSEAGHNDDDIAENDAFDRLLDEAKEQGSPSLFLNRTTTSNSSSSKKKNETASEAPAPILSSHSLSTMSVDEYDDDGFLVKPKPKWDEIPLDLRMPDQDVDAIYEGPETKLTDDLAEIKDKMHELAFHLFNDQTHVIRQPDAQYFGASRRKKRHDVNTELERLLEIGQYSSNNLIISRISGYLEPLIGSTLPFLSATRTVFNIFTWRDPFLSFWVFIGGILLTLVFFLFPWRLFFGVAGVALVGPQNLLFRLIRERKETDEPEKYFEQPESMHDLFLGGELPENQPLVSSHPPVNQKYRELERSRIDSKEVHHVVVPHTRLMYQRFFDWPPEPKHAYVRQKPLHSTVRRSFTDGTVNGSNRPRSASDYSRQSSQGGGYHTGRTISVPPKTAARKGPSSKKTKTKKS